MARQRRRRIQTAGPARILETLHPFLLLLLISAGLMLVPALHAVAVGDIALAETFFAAALVQGVLTLTVILATFGRPATTFGDNRLLALLLTYFALPLFLAVPLVLALPSLTWTRAYFEMLSCLTTTGATLFDEPGRIAPSIHLWRGLIGWLGGFIFLVAALAILAPLRLGGFEIEATLGTGASSRNRQVSTSAVATNARILRFARLVLVPYAVLTFALALLLMLAGEGGLVASVHAMSVLATSGISSLSGLDVAASGRMGEALMALFLIAAVTQKVMRVFWEREIGPPRLSDPEIKIAVASVVAITLLLFLRSYVAALDVEAQRDLPAALRAIWGSAFTVLSYLTTLGFESMDWGESRAWSGLGAGFDGGCHCHDGRRRKAFARLRALQTWCARDGATGPPELCRGGRDDRAADPAGGGNAGLGVFDAVSVRHRADASWSDIDRPGF